MSQPATLTRVAIYLRARSMQLAAEQSAEALTFVSSVLHWRIVAVFCDINGGPARPGRTGAVGAAQAGGFDLLLVTGLDRLTRSTDELHDLIGQFTAAKVVVCTLDVRATSRTRHDGGPQLLVLTSAHTGNVAHRLKAAATAYPGSPALTSRPARADEEQ